MNLKKVTQKNADGSSISYEFDVPKMQGVPDHPGEPKGTDTVPAWLTPGEFVMNAEATRMFEPQIEAMNDAGRAVQRQQGGTIPEYKAEGGTVTDYDIPADASGNINDLIYSAMSNPSEQSYTYKPGQTEDRNQNIYNFAYEGKIGLDTVPNATPFDKSIIIQAMNDAQGNSEVPMDTSVPEPITPGYVPQYGVNRDPKYAEIIKQYAPTGDEFSLSDVYDFFINPTISNPSQSKPEDVPVNSNSDVPLDLDIPNTTEGYKQFTRDNIMARTGTGSAMIDEFGLGLLPGEGGGVIEREGTKDTLDVLDEVTNGVISTQSRRDSKDTTETKDTGDTSSDKGTEQANAVNNIVNSTNDEPNPGTDGVSTGKVIETGEDTIETDPDMWDKAMSFIGDAFDEILDTKSLTQAAMLYLGSRALGYSHAGSINFVGKNYAQQIGNKLKVADKATLSNKYTKDSVEKYRKSGNLKDLELAKNIQKLETVDMVDKSTGKTVTVTKFEDKNTGKISFLDSNMKPVDTGKLRSLADSTAYNTKMQGRVSSNFKAEVKRASGGDDDVLNELSSRLPNDQAFGEALVRQANKMGLDSNTINNSAPSIVRDMIRDLGQKKNLVLNETAIMPYINKQLVSFSVKDNELKKQIDNASTEVVEKLNQSISSDPAELSSKWKQYSEEFSKLKKNNPEKYSSYVRRAGDGFTPIAVYITEKLAGK